MTRSERRLLVDTSTLGVLLTLVAIALDWAGILAAPEHFFYDLRARRCRYFSPPPTDKLVHLDIDDGTLEAMGAWPWPRSWLAEIVDEVNLAGAKALATDVIFSEPQAPSYQAMTTGNSFTPTTAPATTPSNEPQVIQARKFDHDAAFAAALKRFDKAIVPVSLNLNVQQPASSVYRHMVVELFSNLELDREPLLHRLRSKGLGEADLPGEVRKHFLPARQEAMFERIDSEARGGDIPFEQLQRKLLPGTDPRILESSPLQRLLESQHERFQALRALRRYARALPPDLPPVASTRDERTTLRVFIEPASSTGFVDYVTLADGVVRSVPLWVNHRDWLFPQMGLSLACAMLDVKVKDVIVRDDSVVIPRPGGEIVIPVRMEQTPQGMRGMFFDIPWFGTGDWEKMYDYPKHEDKKQHVSLAAVWEACAIRHRIVKNNQAIDTAISTILDNDAEYKLGLDPARARRYFANPPDPYDTEARRDIAKWTLEQSGITKWLENYAKYKDSELEPNELIQRDILIQSRRAIEEGPKQNDSHKADLGARRAELRTRLGGKAALLGWTATGSIADLVPTSIHTRCPGVVVHGVIFNAIMKGDFWYRVPTWVTPLAAAAMGLLTTLVVARLSPWKAMGASLVLVAGYLAFNGIYLFDKHNLLMGVASPLTAVGLVWAGGTLARYILESALRARIKRRFERYVDPMLVNFVVESDAPLDGQVKELTVVFTDLGGFTALTERLGERTVPLLNRYMGLMVPLIRGRRGYLNKFLGDGIMYFFGAPVDNSVHAYDAVASVLEMLDAMGPFNDSLAQEGLPRLEVRAGIASGNMVVGDAGPADRSASDYTVLGDTVNLGARLEPANKVFGSKILINHRTRELIGDRVLVRPIGKIQVVGKKEGVAAYEALSLIERATDEQKRLAEMTERMVRRFMEAAFEPCLAEAAGMEEAFGACKLTGLYRQLCEQYLRQPPGTDFDGQIVLTAK